MRKSSLSIHTANALAILFAMTWMVLIVSFGRTPGSESAELSGNITKLALELLSVFNATVDAHVLHTFIRKLAHVTLYFFLAIFIFGAIKPYCKRPHWQFFITLSIAIVYAGLDEWQQNFIPGRSGELMDVIYDTLGATLGLIIIIRLNHTILSASKS